MGNFSNPVVEGSPPIEVLSERSERGPVLALAAIVLVGFGTFALLAGSVHSPRAFSDELIYFDAAASIVEGDGLTIRGEPYRYAPLYPILLSPLLWVAPDREAAYELVKLLNALLWALVAIPVFLLARRLLAPWPSVVVAALSVTIPSAMYVSVVMTESLAYLVSAWALLTIVLALERPSVLRQIAALGLILVATGVRTQFFALFGVYLLGLVVVLLVMPVRRARPKPMALALWPTLGLVVVGAIALLVQGLLEAGGPPRGLGAYSALWRMYELDQVGRWFVYQLANLELYVAVIPLAVAPTVVTMLVRRGRQGSERHAAFLALVAATNIVFLLLGAAFNATEWSGGLLHDRVVFYVVPLWLILLFVWIAEGAPRPVFTAALGAALAMALPFTLPISDYARDEGRLQFNAVTTTLWASVDEALASATVSTVIVLGAYVLALVLIALFLPASRRPVFPAVVFAAFILTATLSWATAARNGNFWYAVLPRSERGWLDERVREGRRVTLLVATAPCGGALGRDALYLTEFFNSSVVHVARVGAPIDTLPSPRVRVGPDRTLLLPNGDPLAADYVVAQPGVQLAGRRVVERTRARLTLWNVGGTVRVRGVSSDSELTAAVCRARAE